MSNMTKKIISAVIILVVALVITVNSSKDYKDLKQQLKSSLIAHNPDRELALFSLIDHNNNEFSNDHLKGKWTLLMFIYTHCPDVCPTELLNMSSLRTLLLNNKSKAIPEVVAVTFDPIRDTPKVLKTYVSHFNDKFLGVSGDQKQIDKTVRSFGAYYERVVRDENGEAVTLQSEDPLPASAVKNGYIINHTAQIYLVSPDGQIFAEFPTPHNIEDMASDINLIVGNY